MAVFGIQGHGEEECLQRKIQWVRIEKKGNKSKVYSIETVSYTHGE